MARLTWLLVACLFATAPATAEIFKCADKSGMVRYQNFPCALDSIGSEAVTAAPQASIVSSGVASRPAPAATPAALATMSKSVRASGPRIGMTEDEVRAIWGEPSEIEQDEPRDGRIEIWHYSDGKFVQFSNKHRVLVVQR
jgi:hypothetical protein